MINIFKRKQKFNPPIPSKDMYFSVPLLYDYGYIHELAKLNDQNTKYKVRSVYNSLPSSSYAKSGFEHGRSVNVQEDSNKIKTLADLKPYIEKLTENGIAFVYTMNNISTVSLYDFELQIVQLKEFVNHLADIGVRSITVGSQLLADFFKEEFRDLSVNASTMMDIRSITQAEYVVENLGISNIIPASDLNKDFTFIESFKKSFQNTTLELMADEGCIFACPTKNIHYSLFGRQENIHKCSPIFREFPKFICDDITQKNPALQMSLNRIIFPWELKYYEERGVNIIKLVGRDHPKPELLNKICAYMIGATDIEYGLNEFYNTYNSRFLNSKFHIYGTTKMYEIMGYMPNLEFFIEHKPQCSSQCGSVCKYCYGCADKINEYIKSKNIRTNVGCIG
ncbi:U32 family peptidase [Dehalobacter sp. 14DCB1]|uniref:U32 family peptidase n=1 Tax=Dehalobacter sp. 14DCB1 TaxID=2070227 RepID=UPI00104DBD5A|nr:U32 family peptidase [Dehalobacter sp. 14DCB1]TCX48925.1 phage tail protein [Dehalobacter sp. 14DCB1]